MTAGEVMARPNPSQLAFRRSTDIVGLTGSHGNPDLLPFEAKQYDAGVEYYISDVSYVSAALLPHGDLAIHHQHRARRK